MAFKYKNEMIAWANGEKIQFRDNTNMAWRDCLDYDEFSPNWNSIYTEYRIKPKNLLFRVALMRNETTGDGFYIKTFTEEDYHEDEKNPNFVKWLTDIIEVDLRNVY